MLRQSSIAALALTLAACSTDTTSPSAPSMAASALNVQAAAIGAVFTSSNATSGNSVLVFTRAANGNLASSGSVATGGTGTGAGLGSQGAVTLSDDGRFLFVVNAGSNSISAFSVTGTSLSLITTVGSGGTMPISVTVHGRMLYVLNAGGNGNITGFTLSSGGVPTMLAGSSRALSGNAVGPAEVAFDPRGAHLVVTEKNTNAIDVYQVADNGYASGPTTTPASGVTPFGFSFNQWGLLVVSEAFGGAAGASATSSYRINANNTLSVVTASAPTHQTSACWAVVTNDGRYAYIANTGSASVSGYGIHEGALSLLTPSGHSGTTGTSPSDAALSVNSQFLYVRDGSSNEISAFAISSSDGSLQTVTGATGLPAGSVGLAAR